MRSAAATEGKWLVNTEARVKLVLLSAAVAFAAGCGVSAKSGPPMGDVTGTVTYNKKPVAEANVTFFPTEKGKRPAVGMTNSSGKYRLSISGTEQGAVAGPCQVAIVLRAPYDGPIPEGMSPGYAKEQFQNQGKPLIPEKYFSTQSSGLSVEVKPGRNVFDFALQD